MKKLLMILVSILLVFTVTLSVSAHSGRTDAQGGHKDNKNKSGLGSYHYHHGYGPHLHPNGVCPYETKITTSSSTSSSNTASQTVQKDVAVDSIKVSTHDCYITIGEEKNFFVTFSPSSASNKELMWQSSDDEIITVKDNTVTAVGVGLAELTVISNNFKSDHVHITVVPVIDSIEVAEPKEIIHVDEPYQMELTNISQELPNEFLEWSSNNESVVSVDDYGLISPMSSGEAIITCKSKTGLSSTINVKSYNRITDVDILDENIVLEEYLKQVIPLSLTPNDSNIEDVKWKVNNPNVAMINEEHEVVALGAGRTSIYAIVGGTVRDSIVIEVEKALEVDSYNSEEEIEVVKEIDGENNNFPFLTVGTIGVIGYLFGRKSKKT